MLVFGRLSVRIVCPEAKEAATAPLFATAMVQFQFPPGPTLPPTLSVFVAVRSGELAVTVSLQPLFPSLLSVTLLLGSTEQVPAARGLANVPVALGVAVNCTSKEPGLAIVTVAPLAVQVRLLLAMLQLMLPLLVMPLGLATLAAP